MSARFEGLLSSEDILKKRYIPKENEAYMSSDQLKYFRDKLLSWKKAIMHEMDVTLQSMKEESETTNDVLDRASQEELQSIELRTKNREFKLMKKIDAAINRIDHGSFGYCTETGEEIGLERLEIRPICEMCVQAKSLLEKKESERKLW